MLARVDSALPRPGALVGHVVDEDGSRLKAPACVCCRRSIETDVADLVSGGGQGAIARTIAGSIGSDGFHRVST